MLWFSAFCSCIVVKNRRIRIPNIKNFRDSEYSLPPLFMAVARNYQRWVAEVAGALCLRLSTQVLITFLYFYWLLNLLHFILLFIFHLFSYRFVFQLLHLIFLMAYTCLLALFSHTDNMQSSNSVGVMQTDGPVTVHHIMCAQNQW